MNKETISPKQAVSMLVIFLLGTAALFIMGVEAEMDVWLAVIVALGTSTLVLCIYARLLSILPESTFFETLEKLLGKPITFILVLIMTLFTFDLANIVLANYGLFVETIGLTETPIIVIFLSMMLVCAFAVKGGVEVLGRWSSIFIIIIIGFALLVIPLIMGKADLKNIQPTLYNGFKPIFKGTFRAMAFPFTQTVVFLLAFPAFRKGTNTYKIFLKGLYIAGAILLIISTLNIMVLSASYAKTVAYPTYLVLSIVRIGKFLNRLEVLAAAVFCMAVFIKISIILLATCKGITYLCKAKNYRTLVFPVALLIVGFSATSFSSVTQFQKWLSSAFPYYMFVFAIVLPFLIFISVEIRYRLIKKSGKLEMFINKT